MPTKKVRYTQPLFGEANAAGYLIMVPGASVLIRQNGVACSVFADSAGTTMTNPVPTGVPTGTAGVDVNGTLLVYLNPGSGYDGLATVGAAVSTFPISDVPVDVGDVQVPVTYDLREFGTLTAGQDHTSIMQAAGDEMAANDTLVIPNDVTVNVGALAFTVPFVLDNYGLLNQSGEMVWTGATGGDIIIRNLRSQLDPAAPSVGATVRANSCQGLIVLGGYLTKVRGGIRALDTPKVHIIGVDITEDQADIAVSSTPINIITASDVLISRNRIQLPVTAAIVDNSHVGFDLRAVKNGRVLYNRVLDGYTGISAKEVGTDYTENLLIQGNYFRGQKVLAPNASQSMYLQQVRGATITDNDCIDFGHTGIGIVNGSSLPAYDIITSENRLYTDDTNALYGVLYSAVTRGAIRNNISAGAGATGSYQASGGSGVDITNNICNNTKAAGRGVILTNQSGGKVEGNTGAGGQYGIRLTGTATGVRIGRNPGLTGTTGVYSNIATGEIILDDEGTAAPTAGTHAVGSRRRNTAPSANGVSEWVCTTAGTPGTWMPIPVTPIRFAEKTADQSVVDTTATDITGLVVALGASETWEFEGVIFYDSTTANDMTASITVPTGASLRWSGVGPATTATSSVGQAQFAAVSASGSGTAYGGGRAAAAAVVRIGLAVRGRVVTGATAGNLQFRASKTNNTDAASPADDLTIYADSHLRAFRVA